MASAPEADDQAGRVRATWDRLAQTPWRDFFIASHAGWDEPSAWKKQAAIDLRGYLMGIGRDWLARQQVLEIGCGVGRLAALLAGLVQGYTGIDISSGMLEEAKRRCAGLSNARFLLGSGRELPQEARDRRYGAILAVAVFIHCPRELIEETVRSAWPLLAEGGTFRMQLRVDPGDPESPLLSEGQVRLGRVDEAVPLPVPDTPLPGGTLADAVPSEALALAGHRDYGGHLFRVAEARSVLGAVAPGSSLLLHRPAPDLLYAVLDKR